MIKVHTVLVPTVSLALFWYMTLLLARTDRNAQSHAHAQTNGMIGTCFKMTVWVTSLMGLE